LQVELGKFLLEHRRQLLADVVGGGDVAAEDDGMEALLHPVLNDQFGGGQLLVVP
jgi:hypothetical protein